MPSGAMVGRHLGQNAFGRCNCLQSISKPLVSRLLRGGFSFLPTAQRRKSSLKQRILAESHSLGKTSSMILGPRRAPLWFRSVTLLLCRYVVLLPEGAC